MDGALSRTELLIGEEALAKLSKAKVAIFGLGGVGGASFLALSRSAIGSFLLVDFDTVEPSNLNRQLLFEKDDIGLKKTEIAAKYPAKIGFESNIKVIDEKVDLDFFSRYSLGDVDFVIDAIDDIKGKIAIIKECFEKSIPFISCLGMGKRLDPSKVILSTLDKTTGDPLAKRLRKELKDLAIPLDKIPVAFSLETPSSSGQIVSSMVFVPMEAGNLMASFALKELIK